MFKIYPLVVTTLKSKHLPKRMSNQELLNTSVGNSIKLPTLSPAAQDKVENVIRGLGRYNLTAEQTSSATELSFH